MVLVFALGADEVEKLPGFFLSRMCSDKDSGILQRDHETSTLPHLFIITSNEDLQLDSLLTIPFLINVHINTTSHYSAVYIQRPAA
jgi:hypothetical protein